eukprot:bmy_17764T0
MFFVLIIISRVSKILLESRILILVIYHLIFKFLTNITLVQALVLLLEFQKLVPHDFIPHTLPKDTLNISAGKKKTFKKHLFLYAKSEISRGFLNSTLLNFTLSRPFLMWSHSKS